MVLSRLGVEDKVVISVLAHKDNAAKATINAAACVITSALKPEQIKRYKKYHPEALQLVDEDDEPVFAIDLDEEGPGSINAYGAVFGAATNAEGFATITIVLDPTNEDKKALIADKFGRALMHLADLEEQLLDRLGELDAEEESILSNIEEV